MVGGGAGAGLEVCLRLARAGAGVLVADRDAAAAEATAALVRTGRVSAWALRADPEDDHEVDLLAARARDLGGADLLVVAGVGDARAARVAARLLPATPVVIAGDDDARLAVRTLEHLGAAEVGAVVVIA